MYSVTEGGSVTATVSVMSDDVTLDRDVVVIVMTSDGTAGPGIAYMPSYVYMENHVHSTVYIAINRHNKESRLGEQTSIDSCKYM